MTRSKLKIFLWIWSLFVLSAVLITSSRMHAQGQQFVPDELLLKFRAGTPSSKVDEAINQVGATILERSIGDPDLYRVRVSAGTNLDNAIRRFMQNPDVVRATRNPVEHLPQVEQQFVPDELLVKFRYRAPRSTVDQANIRLGATIREQSIGDPDLYWVKLQPGIN